MIKALKSFLNNYFSSFVYYYKKLKFKFLGIIFLTIWVGVLDALGLSMFLPLLKMAGEDRAVTSDSLGNFGVLSDFFNFLNIEFTLIVALSCLFIFFILKGIMVYFSSMYKIKVIHFFISKLRIKLINQLSNFSYNNFISADVGRIQNTLTTEVGKVTSAFTQYASIIQNLMLVVVYMGVAFMMDWKFALLTCLGGILSNFLYANIYANTKKQSRNLTKNNSDFNGLMIQFVLNFKYLKATGLQNRYGNKLINTIKHIESTDKKIGSLGALVQSTREPMMIGVICLVILIEVFVLGGKLSSVMVSLLFFYRAMSAILQVQLYYNNFLGNSGSLENMKLFEKELAQGAEGIGKTEVQSFNNKIQIKNLSFFYQNTQILKNINLEIKKNQTIAFVGESGSGKTTLLNIVTGLIKPNKGELIIDDLPIDQVNLYSYQSKIGYISQEPVVFNDTIYNNVTFWEELDKDSNSKFENAIKKASIDKFVNSLPEKENTLLGNNGINLSGGQKQRISIARELYKNIDLLILDEATSALDSETEKEIQENIDQLKGDYTIIIVAHRLSTIRKADVIYFMDNGEIANYGSFNDLCKKSERFKKMVELQEL